MIRLTIIPAYNAPLPGSPDVVTVPSDVFDLNDGIAGNIKFKDGLYIGIPETEQVKFKINLSSLGGDLSDLRDYIITPTYTNGGEIVIIDAPTRTFDTANVWVFENLTTGETLFIGVQKMNDEVPIEANAFAGNWMEVVLEHITKFIFTTEFKESGSVVSAHKVVNSLAFAASASDIFGPETVAYTEMYEEDTNGPDEPGGVIDDISLSIGFGWYHRTSSTTVAATYQFYFYRLSHVYYLIAEYARIVFSELMRHSSATFHIESERSGAVHNPSSNGHPLDHWLLYEHDHLDWGLADTTAQIDYTNFYIIGRVTLYDETETVGGFFSDDQKSSITIFDTLWDFLSETTEAALAKGIFHTSINGLGVPTIVLKFYRIEADTVGNTPVVIGADDFPETPTITISAHRQAGAKAAITGGHGDDSDAIGKKNSWAASNDDEWAVPRGFHNCRVMVKNGSRQYVYNQGFTTDSQTITLLTPNVNSFLIFYPTTANGLLSEDQMVRAHHHCGVDIGVSPILTTLNVGTVMPSPHPDSIGADIEDNLGDGDTLFGTPYRSSVLEQQSISGIPQLVCDVITNRFGKRAQTEYEGDVGLSVCPPNQIGNMVDETSFPSGNIFLNGETYFGTLPGKPMVIEISYDLISCESTVKLLGTP